jgi:hypothetical protein
MRLSLNQPGDITQNLRDQKGNQTHHKGGLTGEVRFASVGMHPARAGLPSLRENRWKLLEDGAIKRVHSGRQLVYN